MTQRRKCVLVVAHDAEFVQAVRNPLEAAGHSVVIADSGLDAILWAEIFLPDLILVDPTLPDMDGPAVIGILQRLPSTAALESVLLNSRFHNSREMYPQIAPALAVCYPAECDHGAFQVM